MTLKNSNKGPELLSPAGTLKSMRAAFAYGADAVYAGQPRYSLRARNNEFSQEVLESAIQEAHQQNKKVFVASNIISQNNKVKTYIRDLTPVVEANPDALIMADPGLIMMVREQWPDLEVHLSVQSNVMNYQAVKFWQMAGVSRVILSRELSLDEIGEIRQHCPEMELEVFIHGALCMAHSGRCLLSGYFNHRDPNQGACTNSCRWDYKVKAVTKDEWGNETPAPEVEKSEIKPIQYVVEETNRPGVQHAIEEDEFGTYIFNSKDLRAIQHVETLIKMGIHCLKIEGRTKSDFYTARTTQLYRQAIDDSMAGKPFDMSLMDQLEGLSTRGYTEGFYRRHVPEDYQSYDNRTDSNLKQQVVGEFLEYNDGWLTVNVKNQFSVGNRLEIMTPGGQQFVTLAAIEDLKGHAMERAPGSGITVKIPMDEKPVGDIAHGFLIHHWES
jgi:U32 family peptidase